MLFISPCKLFLFSRYLKFCHNVLVLYDNCLIRKISLFSKFIAPQLGEQTIAIYISLDIPRSKDNQTMKIGQIVEWNMRNIFLEKAYTKCL